MTAPHWIQLAGCRDEDPELFFPLDEDAPGDWADRALCAEVDGELFFGEKGGSNRAAKAVCARCEVRAECAAYALEHAVPFGVWGGLSARERRVIRRRRAA